MKKLSVNQLAPLFSARDYKGRKINLEQLREKKVLLTFHVFASCPFCNLRVNETRMLHEEWQAKGLEIIHVFPSPGKAIASYAGKTDPPFTIISDQDKILYNLFGLQTSLTGMFLGSLNIKRLLKAFKVVGLINSLRDNDAAMHQLPGDFLIDEAGIIIKAYYAKNTSDNLPLAEISAYLNIGKEEVAA